jgi:hypothetical protein
MGGREGRTVDKRRFARGSSGAEESELVWCAAGKIAKCRLDREGWLGRIFPAFRKWPRNSSLGNEKGDNMTRLTKPVQRLTAKLIGSRSVIVTLAPAGSQSEALIGLRLKGKRTQYVVALSDLYRMAAIWHGQKESAAKRTARKNGISWKTAKRQFAANNSI